MLHYRYSVSSRIDSETGEFLEWQETPAEEYEEKEIFEILDEERTEADASSALYQIALRTFIQAKRKL